MSEQQMIVGSIEILTESRGASAGMEVEIIDVANIPAGLEALRSMTAFVAVDPPREGVDAEWTAQTASGRDAEVLFRQKRELSLIEIATALGGGEAP